MQDGMAWISLFMKRFIKYFIILLILIGMTIPLISVASELATKRILDSSSNQLSSGLLAFENQIKKSREVVQALLYEKALIDLLLLEGKPTISHYMQYDEVQRRLQNFAPSQDYLDYSYIVFEKNPVFISSALSDDDSKKAYPAFFEYVGLSFEEWSNRLFSGPFDVQFLNSLDYKISNGSAINSFTYLINMTYYTAIDNSAIMGCVFNNNRLIDALLTKDIKEDSFLVMRNNQGDTLLSYQITPDTLALEDTTSEYLELNGIGYQLTTMKNDFLGVEAVLGIPVNILQLDFERLVLVSIIYFIAGLLLILLFSLFFSLREAKMMRNLISMATQTADTQGKSNNEFIYLQNVLKRLGNEDKVKLLRIQQLSFEVVVRMLHQLLLRGVYTEKEASDMQSYFGDRFNRSIVVKLQLLDPQEHLDQIEKLLHGNLRVAFELVALPQNEIAVLLFLSEEQSGEAEQEVVRAIANQIPLKAGFSLIYNSIFQVRNAYLQAQAALQFLADGEYVGVFAPTSATAIPDAALFNKLYDCILYGELDGVEDIFGFVYKKFPPQSLAISEQQQLYYSLRQSVVAVAAETFPSNPELIRIQLTPAVGESIIEQINSLKETSLLLCNLINGKKRSGNTELKENIMQYLKDNFADQGLCAAKIADTFSISEKYVYLFIKEQTGQPLGTIIESIRLDEAKCLLRTTGESNRKIAEITGFGSENTFYRTFSKYHGVSPAVWRKQQK